MLSTLKLMSEHLKRLEEYTKTMRQIRSFEEIEPQREKVGLGELRARVAEISEPLNAVVAWLNLAVGITGMYTLISGLLAAGGCRPLPEGKPAAKTDSVLGKGEENYETGCGRQH